MRRRSRLRRRKPVDDPLRSGTRLEDYLHRQHEFRRFALGGKCRFNVNGRLRM